MQITPKSFLRLMVASLCVAVVWCGVLPWVSRQTSIQQRLQFLEDRGIDPSAMYYTDLDAMGPILDRIEGRNQITTHYVQKVGPEKKVF